MASHGLTGAVGALIAGSLIFSSTAASASTTASVPQVNPWAVLTAMSGGAPAATMCGAAAATAAAQAPSGCVLPVLDTPPPAPAAAPAPPLPLEPTPGGLGISPLIFGLLAIAAGVGIFLAVNNDSDSNSPA